MDFFFFQFSVPASTLSGHIITTIVDDGSGKPRVTTASAHGLSVSDNITISGTALHNGATDIAEVPSATVFVTGSTFQGDDGGGRWDAA